MNYDIILEKILSGLDELKSTLNSGLAKEAKKILDDVDLCQLLNVSKRTTATWRAKKLIAYSKIEGKIFYTMNDVMQMLENFKSASSLYDEQLTVGYLYKSGLIRKNK